MARRQHARKSALVRLPKAQLLTMQDWPVSYRLLAVIVLALIMGLVFGGLRVAAAVDSAAGFGRVTQLATFGQQTTGLVQALEDERDETAGVIPAATSQAAAKAVRRWYAATDTAAARVKALGAGIGGAFPANIQARVATVLSAISHLDELRSTAQSSQSALAVIADYSGPIGDLLSLNTQIAQGTADSRLATDVQTLNSLAMGKEEATQQRAILFNALSQQLFADDELQALTTAESEQAADLAEFSTTASPAEQTTYRDTVAGPSVNRAELIEEYVISVGSLNTSALNLSPQAAPQQWYSAMSGTISKTQAVELSVAGSIVARSRSLQRGAERYALVIAVLTALILLVVLIATVFVARSLVRPLRRLRTGALDIATVQLPERVRQLGEALNPAADMRVAPIDVLSADEIGQVARAFDQVHAEAVRLAGNEAVLRGSFNAMFVNLSRRSQLLIERLARTIDSLEQNEEDPGRLSTLFNMDHLVTRMRRNSENLLVLAGRESPRKWSEAVLLAAVAQAATAEIEQYQRVALTIQPAIAVAGHAVSDVVHLLAEIIENATAFSPKDTLVRMSAQQLASGGVLFEISDSGVGVSPARLAELNHLLDNPPIIDESVGRHMGLFAVAHLAARHGVRVRLRPGAPRGLTALVWLPDTLTERVTRSYAGWAQPAAAPAGHPARGTNTVPAAAPAAAAAPVVTPRPARAARPPASSWFQSRRPSVPAAASPARPAAWAEQRHATQVMSDPVRSDRTVAGMPVRVPRANLIRGSTSACRRAESGDASRPAAGPDAQRPAGPVPEQPPAAPGPERSPEMARSLLSGFQRGAGRPGHRTPSPGEGADR